MSTRRQPPSSPWLWRLLTHPHIANAFLVLFALGVLVHLIVAPEQTG